MCLTYGAFSWACSAWCHWSQSRRCTLHRCPRPSWLSPGWTRTFRPCCKTGPAIQISRQSGSFILSTRFVHVNYDGIFTQIARCLTLLHPSKLEDEKVEEIVELTRFLTGKVITGEAVIVGLHATYVVVWRKQTRGRSFPRMQKDYLLMLTV